MFVYLFLLASSDVNKRRPTMFYSNSVLLGVLGETVETEK